MGASGERIWGPLARPLLSHPTVVRTHHAHYIVGRVGPRGGPAKVSKRNTSVLAFIICLTSLTEWTWPTIYCTYQVGLNGDVVSMYSGGARFGSRTDTDYSGFAHFFKEFRNSTFKYVSTDLSKIILISTDLIILPYDSTPCGLCYWYIIFK